MGKTCSLILPYVHYVHVICLFAISFISHFNLGGRIMILIISIPGHRASLLLCL